MTSTRLAVYALILFADLLHAQVEPVPSSTGCSTLAGARCRSTLITEVGYGMGPTRGYSTIFTTSLGFMKPVTSRVGLGAVATLGLWHDFNVAVGPRFRYYATPTTTFDITPGVLVMRDNPNWNRLVLDASVMSSDRVGVFVQAASIRQYQYDYSNFMAPLTTRQKMVVFFGLRLGSKPGRIGTVVDAVVLAAAVIALVIACADGSCLGWN